MVDRDVPKGEEQKKVSPENSLFEHIIPFVLDDLKGDPVGRVTLLALCRVREQLNSIEKELSHVRKMVEESHDT